MYKYFYVLLLFVTIAAYGGRSESTSYVQESRKSGANYFKIVQQERDRFSHMDLSIRDNRKAQKQFERWVSEWKNVVNTDGSFPKVFPEFSLLHLKENTPLSMLHDTKNVNNNPKAVLAAESWEQIGPQKNVFPNNFTNYPGMGRVNCVRKLGATTYIVGTPNGGVWKTTDAGANWYPKTDALARIGISDIVVHSTNASILFAITGDRDTKGKDCQSIGCIKSTDAGETWATTGLVIDPSQTKSDSASVTNIAINPKNADNLVVNVNGTSYHSTNGGESFVAAETEIKGANDLLWINIDGANALYLSDTYGRIHKSVDNGLTFTQIYAGTFAVSEIVLRFNQRLIDGNVYFLAGQKDSAIVFKFAHSASTSPVSPSRVGASIAGFDPQEVYNIAFSVNPDYSQEMIALGVDGYFTDDGAATWAKKLDAYDSKISGETYVHPDHHFANYIDADNILLTHDGGVSLINVVAKPLGHQDLTGNLIIGQIYSTAIVNSDDNNQNVLMGLQDNDGFSKSPTSHSGQWVAAIAGDGTAAAINYNNPLIRYLGGTEGQLSRTSTAYSGGHDDMKVIVTPKTNAPFSWELLMHDTNPNHLFGGFGELFYTTNEGETWDSAGTNVGPVVDIEQRGIRVAVVGATGQQMAAYKEGSGFIEFLTMTRIPGESLFNSLSLGEGRAVYATVPAYNDGSKVFKSIDNGQTWENISGDLPNVIMNKIVCKITGLGSHDEILFVATNVGVYYKEGSATTTWTELGTDLPFTSVTDIDINYTTDMLIASTFGRGIWQIPITPGVTDVKNSDHPTQAIMLSPNPVDLKHNVKVQLGEGVIEDLRYQIFNYIGGNVLSGTISQQQSTINTSGLTAGTYLVVFKNMTSAQDLCTQRLVIH